MPYLSLVALEPSLEPEVLAGVIECPVGVTGAAAAAAAAGDCCNNGDRAPAKAVDMACTVAGFTAIVGVRVTMFIAGKS